MDTVFLIQLSFRFVRVSRGGFPDILFTEHLKKTWKLRWFIKTRNEAIKKGRSSAYFPLFNTVCVCVCVCIRMHKRVCRWAFACRGPRESLEESTLFFPHMCPRDQSQVRLGSEDLFPLSYLVFNIGILLCKYLFVICYSVELFPIIPLYILILARFCIHALLFSQD